MNILRVAHREARSAWRSVRYDLRREQHPAYDVYARSGRRLRTAVAVATLAVGGAAATYLGVVGGLATLVPGDDAPPGALPAIGVAAPAGGPTTAGFGDRAARVAAEPPSMAPSRRAPSEASLTRPGRPSAPSRPTRTALPAERTARPHPPVPTPAPQPTPTCAEPRDPDLSPVPTKDPSPDPSPRPMPQ